MTKRIGGGLVLECGVVYAEVKRDYCLVGTEVFAEGGLFGFDASFGIVW